MISLVNGYVCKSHSDVADAMQGKEPPSKAGQLPYSSGNAGKIFEFIARPAAKLDGAPVTASDSAVQNGAEAPRGIDFLV
jgi:hypothetical protein